MGKLRKEREVKIGRETGKTEPYVAARAFFKNLKRGGRQKFCDLPRDISELLQIKARGNSVQNETTVRTEKADCKQESKKQLQKKKSEISFGCSHCFQWSLYFTNFVVAMRSQTCQRHKRHLIYCAGEPAVAGDL